jgi:hypothetical protein
VIIDKKNEKKILDFNKDRHLDHWHSDLRADFAAAKDECFGHG